MQINFEFTDLFASLQRIATLLGEFSPDKDLNIFFGF